jgi:transposase
VLRIARYTQSRLERPARSGALFVFFGKRRTALKVLFYDGTGLCLFYKRLEQGCFQVPHGLEEGVTSLMLEEHVCVFRRSRTPIPGQADHRFRQADHRFRASRSPG